MMPRLNYVILKSDRPDLEVRELKKVKESMSDKLGQYIIGCQPGLEIPLIQTSRLHFASCDSL
jgi:hypothetical protein